MYYLNISGITGTGCLVPVDSPAGILLVFIFKMDICFYQFPFAPTPEGQYLLKDFAIFFAILAIAGSLKEKSTPNQYH